MHRKVKANGQCGEEHRRDLQELPVVDRRPYIELHDEAVIDSGCYESREIELKQHAEENW